MDKVEILKLIKTTLTRRGEGVHLDPVRVITQYWTMDGELVFEIDPIERDLGVLKNQG